MKRNTTALLLEITRWALRFLLVLLGCMVLLAGILAENPFVILAGVLLPGSEGLFALLKKLESKVK